MTTPDGADLVFRTGHLTERDGRRITDATPLPMPTDPADLTGQLCRPSGDDVDPPRAELPTGNPADLINTILAAIAPESDEVYTLAARAWDAAVQEALRRGWEDPSTDGELFQVITVAVNAALADAAARQVAAAGRAFADILDDRDDGTCGCGCECRATLRELAEKIEQGHAQ